MHLIFKAYPAGISYLRTDIPPESALPRSLAGNRRSAAGSGIRRTAEERIRFSAFRMMIEGQKLSRADHFHTVPRYGWRGRTRHLPDSLEAALDTEAAYLPDFEYKMMA